MKLLTVPSVFVALLFSSVFLTSCEPDDRASDKAPTIIFQNGSLSESQVLPVGSTARFDVLFLKNSRSGDLSRVRYTRKVGETILTAIDTAVSGGSFNWVQTLILASSKALAIGQSERQDFIFTVFDREGRSATRTVSVTLTKDGEIVPSTVFNTIRFDNSRGYFNTSKPGSGSLTQSEANAVNTAIDLTYYFDEPSSMHSFISPQRRAAYPGGSDINWQNGSVVTQFRTTEATVAQFEATKTNTSLINPIFEAARLSYYPGEVDGVRAGGFEWRINRVFAFQTAGGRRGLILVRDFKNGEAFVDISVQP
jgi:hypothetical protein